MNCIQTTFTVAGKILVPHSRTPESFWGIAKTMKNRVVRDEAPRGGEISAMKNDLILNLGLQEYLTAVNDQPKPLIIPLCAELPLPDISPLDVYSGTRNG